MSDIKEYMQELIDRRDDTIHQQQLEIERLKDVANGYLDEAIKKNKICNTGKVL